jgi:hypothetical protein
MNLTERDIDWIVAEVVRRLAILSGGREPPESTPITDKVITLETLKKYQQHSELVVTPRAIITPAAKDELKQRNIRLIRHGEPVANNTTNKTTSGKLLAANLGADYQAKTLAQLTAAYGANLEHQPLAALPQLVASHAARVSREDVKAVWFTSQAAHAVCLANREANVWAVQGSDEASVKAAMSSIPANVLVIDPQGKSQYTLRTMMDAFCGASF